MDIFSVIVRVIEAVTEWAVQVGRKRTEITTTQTLRQFIAGVSTILLNAYHFDLLLR